MAGITNVIDSILGAADTVGTYMQRIGQARAEKQFTLMKSYIDDQVLSFNSRIEMDPEYNLYPGKWEEFRKKSLNPEAIRKGVEQNILQARGEGTTGKSPILKSSNVNQLVEEYMQQVNSRQESVLVQLSLKRNMKDLGFFVENEINSIIQDKSIPPQEKINRIQKNYDILTENNVIGVEEARGLEGPIAREVYKGFVHDAMIQDLRNGTPIIEVMDKLNGLSGVDSSGNPILRNRAKPLILTGEEKTEIGNSIKQEWAYLKAYEKDQGMQADAQRDEIYSNGYTAAMNANSEAQMLKLLHDLERDNFYDDEQKYNWDTRLRRGLETIRMQQTDDGKKEFERIRRNFLNNAVSMSADTSIPEQEYWKYLENNRSMFESDDEFKQYYNLRKRDENGVKEGINILKSIWPEGEIDKEKLAELTTVFRERWKNDPNMTPQQTVDFAKGIKSLYLMEKGVKAFGYTGVSDIRGLDSTERIIQATQDGLLSFQNEAQFQEISRILDMDVGTFYGVKRDLLRVSQEAFEKDYAYELSQLENNGREIKPTFMQIAPGENYMIVYSYTKRLRTGSFGYDENVFITPMVMDDEMVKRMLIYSDQMYNSGRWTESEALQFQNQVKTSRNTEAWFVWSPYTIDPFNPEKTGTWIFEHTVGTRPNKHLEEISRKQKEERERQREERESQLIKEQLEFSPTQSFGEFSPDYGRRRR